VSGNVGAPEKEGFSGQQFSEALLASVSKSFARQRQACIITEVLVSLLVIAVIDFA
jgi:hypothetical protein